MRALVQRAREASVTVAGRITGEIGEGLLILVCAMEGDGEGEAEVLAHKIARLRIFRDEAGKMNRALLDTGGAALGCVFGTAAVTAHACDRDCLQGYVDRSASMGRTPGKEFLAWEGKIS